MYSLPWKCMVIALILFYDISSALLGPKIAQMCASSQYDHTNSALLLEKYGDH